MLYCTYLTIYHGTKLPMFYVGSTSVQKIKNGYRGSVASKDYEASWKDELKNNPHLFDTKILSTYHTRNEAYNIESKIHQSLKTYKNSLYINRSTGCPRNNGIAWNKGLKLPHLGGPNPKKALPGKLNGMWDKKRPRELIDKWVAASNAATTGKTYEEIYGKDRADQLKQVRSDSLKLYLQQNPTARQGKNNANAKSYKFVDPNGVTYIIEGGLRVFCKQNKLDTGIAIDCIKGRRASYKGWTIHYC